MKRKLWESTYPIRKADEPPPFVNIDFKSVEERLLVRALAKAWVKTPITPVIGEPFLPTSWKESMGDWAKELVPPRLPEWSEVRAVYDGPISDLVGRIAIIRFKLSGGFGFQAEEVVSVRWQNEDNWWNAPLSNFLLED